MKEKYAKIITTFTSYKNLLEDETKFTANEARNILGELAQLFEEAQQQSDGKFIFRTVDGVLSPDEVNPTLDGEALRRDYKTVYALYYITVAQKNEEYLALSYTDRKKAADVLEVELMLLTPDASEEVVLLPDDASAVDSPAAVGSNISSGPISRQHSPSPSNASPSVSTDIPSNAAAASEAKQPEPRVLAAKQAALPSAIKGHNENRKTLDKKYRASLLAIQKNINAVAVLNDFFAAKPQGGKPKLAGRKDQKPSLADIAWKKPGRIQIISKSPTSSGIYFSDQEYQVFVTWFSAFFSTVINQTPEIMHKKDVFRIIQINNTEQTFSPIVRRFSFISDSVAKLSPGFFSCKVIVTYGHEEDDRPDIKENAKKQDKSTPQILPKEQHIYESSIEITKQSITLEGPCTILALMALVLASSRIFKVSGEMSNFSVSPLLIIGCSQYLKGTMRGLWNQLLSLGIVAKRDDDLQLKFDVIASLQQLPLSVRQQLLKKTVYEIRELFKPSVSQEKNRVVLTDKQRIDKYFSYIKNCAILKDVLKDEEEIKQNPQYMEILSILNQNLQIAAQCGRALLETFSQAVTCQMIFMNYDELLRKILQLEGITLLPSKQLELQQAQKSTAHKNLEGLFALEEIKKFDAAEYLPDSTDSVQLKHRERPRTSLFPISAAEISQELQKLLRLLQSLDVDIQNESSAAEQLRDKLILIGQSYKELQNNSKERICFFDGDKALPKNQTRILLSDRELADAVKDCFLIFLRLHVEKVNDIKTCYLKPQNFQVFRNAIENFKQRLQPYLSVVGVSLSAPTSALAPKPASAPVPESAESTSEPVVLEPVSPSVVAATDEGDNNWDDLMAALLSGPGDPVVPPAADKKEHKKTTGLEIGIDAELKEMFGDDDTFDHSPQTFKRVFRVADVEGVFINLVETVMPGDGHCGFRALNSDRERIGQVLLSGINDPIEGPTNRKMIIEDVRDYFEEITNRVGAIDYSRRRSQNLHYFEELGLPPNIIDAYLTYRALNDDPDNNSELISQLLSRQDVAEAFINWAYIPSNESDNKSSNKSGKEYLSTFSIKLYAKLQKITVFILKEFPTADKRNRIELCREESYEPPEDQESLGEFYLLATGALMPNGAIHYNHFNQLQVLAPGIKVHPIDGVSVFAATANAEKNFTVDFPYTGPGLIKILQELAYLLQLMRKEKKEAHQFELLKRLFLLDHEEYVRLEREANDPSLSGAVRNWAKIKTAIYIDHHHKYETDIRTLKQEIISLISEAVDRLSTPLQKDQVLPETDLTESQLKKLPHHVVAIRYAIECFRIMDQLRRSDPNYSAQLDEVETRLEIMREAMRINGSTDPYKYKKLPTGHDDYKKETREFSHHPFTQIERVADDKLEIVNITEEVKLEKRRVLADDRKRKGRIITEAVLVGLLCLVLSGFFMFVYGEGLILIIAAAAIGGFGGGLGAFKARDHATQHWYLKEYRTITKHVTREDYDQRAKNSNLIGVVPAKKNASKLLLEDTWQPQHSELRPAPSAIPPLNNNASSSSLQADIFTTQLKPQTAGLSKPVAAQPKQAAAVVETEPAVPQMIGNKKELKFEPSYLDRLINGAKDLFNTIAQLLLANPQADVSHLKQCLDEKLEEVDSYLQQVVQLNATDPEQNAVMFEREQIAKFQGELKQVLQERSVLNFAPVMDKLKHALNKLQQLVWQATVRKINTGRLALSEEQVVQLKLSLVSALEETISDLENKLYWYSEAEINDKKEPLLSELNYIETILSLLLQIYLTPQDQDKCEAVKRMVAAVTGVLKSFDATKQGDLLNAATELAQAMKDLALHCKPLAVETLVNMLPIAANKIVATINDAQFDNLVEDERQIQAAIEAFEQLAMNLPRLPNAAALQPQIDAVNAHISVTKNAARGISKANKLTLLAAANQLAESVKELLTQLIPPAVELIEPSSRSRLRTTAETRTDPRLLLSQNVYRRDKRSGNTGNYRPGQHMSLTVRSGKKLNLASLNPALPEIAISMSSDRQVVESRAEDAPGAAGGDSRRRLRPALKRSPQLEKEDLSSASPGLFSRFSQMWKSPTPTASGEPANARHVRINTGSDTDKDLERGEGYPTEKSSLLKKGN